MVIDEQPVWLKEDVHDDGPPMLLRVTLVASCMETAIELGHQHSFYSDLHQLSLCFLVF